MMVGEENGNALNCVVTCGKLNEAIKKQPYLHGKAVFYYLLLNGDIIVDYLQPIEFVSVRQLLLKPLCV